MPNQPKRVTLKRVNEALAAAGYAGVELVHGKGYFYFYGGDVTLRNASVMSYHLSSLTVEQWVAEYKDKVENNWRML